MSKQLFLQKTNAKLPHLSKRYAGVQGYDFWWINLEIICAF